MYTRLDCVDTMKTVTISVRMEEGEAKNLDRCARECGLERSALLKQMLRKGYLEYQFERACAAYRRREISLSRAAEIAGVNIREFILRMPDGDLDMSYSARDLDSDLEGFGK